MTPEQHRVTVSPDNDEPSDSVTLVRRPERVRGGKEMTVPPEGPFLSTERGGAARTWL